jgi:putative membrane protein
MRFKWLNDYWQGIILGLCAIIVSLWLGWSGKLSLYIHPRYVLFTMVMSALGLAVVLIGFWRHSYHGRPVARTSAPGLALGLVCAALGLSLLITQPSALTSDTALQRGINTAALDIATQSSGSVMRLPRNADYSRFSVKEWASLLSQTTDARLFKDKPVDITGFVSPSDDPDVFFVSRFVVSCCAVDARPIGVPVYLPDWRASYKQDQWIQTQGVFIVKPGTVSELVVKPATITKVTQPDDPYAY